MPRRGGWRVAVIVAALALGGLAPTGRSAWSAGSESPADPALTALQRRLSDVRVLRSTFESVRYIAVLKRPLRASGTFLLARERGFVWSQQVPFVQRVTFTQDRLRQESPGTAPTELRASENPLVFTIGRIFLALFSGDAEQLRQFFRAEYRDAGGGRWTLRLVPTRAPIDGVFAEIRLGGKDWIESAELLDRSGDRTAVSFHDVRTVPPELTPDEEAAFAP